MRRTNLTALLAIAALASTPAIARDVRDNDNIVAVAYGDLDIGNPEHVQTLEKRLLTASKEVCGDSSWIDRNCVSRTYQEAKRTLRARHSVALASRN